MDEELNRRLGCIEEKLDRVRTEDIPNIRVDVAREVATLKAESRSSGRFWGLLAGAVGSLSGALLYLLAK